MRRELEPWLCGRRILEARLEDAPPGPKYLGLERAAGQRVLAVSRRGKFLLLPLDGGDELVIHLGMTGVISATRPDKHLRVSLTLDEGEDPQLFFKDPRRFGRFMVVLSGDYRALPTLKAMGPEPLGDFSEADFFAALRASAVAIKPYLLSQKPVSGVGNIYADEALWRSGVHPLTPSNRLSRAQVSRLAQAIREVLMASIAAQGTTLSDYRRVNGEVGGFLSALSAYGHAGEPCARCGDPIEKITVAARGTYLCPRCQRPARRPAGRYARSSS